ncbi:MAG: 3-dehydroquinate synthase, partial [Gammaproteobacteria bacterium]|nr:3-dehydroquinate synthase [Gammaproteobacteria bacterium]
AIERSCRTKAEVVARDEHEHGQRALLNLGHTFGHAIENLAGYGEWLHGEAVAAGMVMAADMSRRLGWLDKATVARIEALIEAAGLPVRPPPLGADAMLEAMGRDKKVSAGRIRLVLLRALGQARVVGDYPDESLAGTLARYQGS